MSAEILHACHRYHLRVDDSALARHLSLLIVSPTVFSHLSHSLSYTFLSFHNTPTRLFFSPENHPKMNLSLAVTETPYSHDRHTHESSYSSPYPFSAPYNTPSEEGSYSLQSPSINYDSHLFQSDSRHDPHILRHITRADHSTLVKVRNTPYLEALQQNQELLDNNKKMRVELESTRRLLDEMMSKLPILIGMNTPDAPAAPPLPSPSPSAPSVGTARWAETRITLGHGLVLPPRASHDECPGVRYWTSSSYTKRTKGKASKPGRHSNTVNKAQTYIEDKDGNPISGVDADQARSLLQSCLHSLHWSGQLTPTSTTLGYEARVYIHTVLANRFPCLRFCEGGMWKTDMFIKQAYPVF
ncbi:hypothetical protein OF83DRAFT_113203 [Amylostereum chailletii]|nr:hypothetical protein OF83DRAFT_113203 [Amylostereum chailletii]